MAHRVMTPRLATGHLDRAADLVRRVDWYRLVVLAEVMVLLVFSVALTVAPQVTLSAVAGFFVEARDASLANRPQVAFLGLVTLGLTITVFRALLGGHSSDSTRSTLSEHGQ